MVFRVFLDANVLVPRRPRDIIFALAHEGLFLPAWSENVLQEMQRHLPPTMSVERRQALASHMNLAFPEAQTNVPLNFAGIFDDSVNEKDRHVVNAAFLSKSELLLTSDRRLRAEVEEFPWLDAQDLPEFVAYTIDADIARARNALVRMAKSLWLQDLDAEDSVVLARLRAYFIKSGWSPEGL